MYLLGTRVWLDVPLPGVHLLNSGPSFVSRVHRRPNQEKELFEALANPLLEVLLVHFRNEFITLTDSQAQEMQAISCRRAMAPYLVWYLECFALHERENREVKDCYCVPSS
eukprot:scaffold3882_cov164-Amphora_coffeaeformis.AAC.5